VADERRALVLGTESRIPRRTRPIGRSSEFACQAPGCDSPSNRHWRTGSIAPARPVVARINAAIVRVVFVLDRNSHVTTRRRRFPLGDARGLHVP
jgi:hypothetical protein